MRKEYCVNSQLSDKPTAALTMTMAMTHSEQTVQQSLEAWPYRRERRGRDPAKKSLLQLMWLALLARFARTH